MSFVTPGLYNSKNTENKKSDIIFPVSIVGEKMDKTEQKWPSKYF